MKKKVDKNVLNESCFMMNIPKPLNAVEGNYLSNNISEDTKIPLQNSLTPPQSISNSPNNKIKFEREDSPQGTEDGDISNEKASPPISSLGPGAEIKGKICHPIPSSSKLEETEALDELCKAATGTSGGRLTFFKEGKLLLELSHRSEQGSWVQVKSKTYWPPPSTTTTTTTIQHPLRHDTPTTHSDDCSSINSSPWSSDHVRKQIGPSPRSKIWLSTEHLIYVKRSPFIRALRRTKVRLRRNPYLRIEGPLDGVVVGGEKGEAACPPSSPSVGRDVKVNERKKRVEGAVARLVGRKFSVKLEEGASVRSLFDRVDNHRHTPPSIAADGIGDSSSSSPSSAFVTPRKRYLKTLESDLESHNSSRKKAHSSPSPALPSSQLKHHCDSPRRHAPSSSPSFHHAPPPSLHHRTTPTNSSTSHNSSAYSIDSLLSSGGGGDPDRRGDYFLRTLLKPDKHRPPSHGRERDRDRDRERERERTHHLDGGTNNNNNSHLKTADRLGSPYSKERKEEHHPHPHPHPLHQHKKGLLPDHRFDLSSQDLARFSSSSSSSSSSSPSPHPALSGLYLNPYLDPRYMMLHSPFLPPAVSQSSDMASAVAAAAAAAAAAAGYSLSPLHFSALTAANSLLPGGGVASPFPPSPSLASQLIRSPTPNRASPLSVPPPHSPSPKLSSPAPHPHPLSPHLRLGGGSPRDAPWPPSSSSSPLHHSSPHKYHPTTTTTSTSTASSSLSPPPQDVPLNLSKPKRK